MVKSYSVDDLYVGAKFVRLPTKDREVMLVTINKFHKEVCDIDVKYPRINQIVPTFYWTKSLITDLKTGLFVKYNTTIEALYGPF